MLAEPIESFAGTCPETATVNTDDYREWAFAILGSCHIQLQVLFVWIGVFDVLFEHHSGWAGFSGKDCVAAQHDDGETSQSRSVEVMSHRNPVLFCRVVDLSMTGVL